NAGFIGGDSADVTVPCVNSSGGSETDSGLHLTSCTTVTTQTPQAADPYASVGLPSIPGTCTANPAKNVAPLPGLKYCGLSLKGNMTLTAGTYIISGGTFQINSNANIVGHGVTFILTGGATISFNGTAQMDFTAPTTGTYAG